MLPADYRDAIGGRVAMAQYRANQLHPSTLSARDRVDEVASILALGVSRLRARQSSGTSAAGAKSSVDFAAVESVCRVHSNREFPT